MINSRRVVAASCAALIFFLVPERASSQVTLLGGNQLMSITSGIAGGEPASVVNSSCTLRFRRHAQAQRITVSTSCPGQRFTLQVQAINATIGVPAPAVTLVDGAPAVNLLTNIPAGGGNGRCTLQYTASATFAQGNSVELGTDVHTVTYTILAP